MGAIVGTEALGNWYGGLGNTWMSMVAGILAMVSNVALNAVLIDGRFGLPALGVRGTALASSIASTLGFAFLLVAFLLRRGGVPRSPATGLSWRDLLRVLRFGAPNGVNWFLEFAAFQIFINVVVSDLGTTTLAAFNVVSEHHRWSPRCRRSASHRRGRSGRRSHRARGEGDGVGWQIKLTLSLPARAGMMGAIYVFPRAILASSVTLSNGAEPLVTGATMLMLAGLWQLFDATSMTLAEALRAAGDTSIWQAAARLFAGVARLRPHLRSSRCARSTAARWGR